MWNGFGQIDTTFSVIFFCNCYYACLITGLFFHPLNFYVSLIIYLLSYFSLLFVLVSSAATFLTRYLYLSFSAQMMEISDSKVRRRSLYFKVFVTLFGIFLNLSGPIRRSNLAEKLLNPDLSIER